MTRYRTAIVANVCTVLVCVAGQRNSVLAAENGTSYAKTDVATGYEVDADWPRKPAEFTWKAMPGIAVDGRDNIWTLNRGNMPVQVYRRDGTLVRAWGDGQFEGAHAVRIDHEGNVWIADFVLHVVRKYTPEGKLLLELGTPGKAGDDKRHFNGVTDMAISRSGDIFVADGYYNSRIVHFDAKGGFVKQWGRRGVGDGEFSLVHGIAMDSKGRLYVTDRNNARVQVFDQSGKFLAQWRDLMVPWGIWITPRDEVYVCGSSPMLWGERGMLGLAPKDQLVMKFDTTGRALQLWAFPKGKDGEEQPGEVNWLHAMAVDSKGDLYLGGIVDKRAQRFVRAGRK